MGTATASHATSHYNSSDDTFKPNFVLFLRFQGNPAGAGAADMAAWSAAGAALPPTAGYYGYDHPTLAAYG